MNIDNKGPKNPIEGSAWSNVDILDPQKLKNAIFRYDPEIVVHFAARCDLEGKIIENYQANTQGTRNLLEALDLCGSIDGLFSFLQCLSVVLAIIQQTNKIFSQRHHMGKVK